MKPLCRAAASATLLLFAGSRLRAQQSGGPPDRPVPVATAPQPVTAPLEERIAAARSVKVMTSILGVELGSDLDEAHEKLDRLCAPGTHPKEEGEGDDEKEPDKKKQDAGEKKEAADADGQRREPMPKQGEEQEEGHKALWQLAGTDYSAIYITADDQEHITSITGILRPEKQMPFDQVGEVSKAPVKDKQSVVWDVLRLGHPLFRVVAKGRDGKASSVMLFVVRRKSGAVVPYNGSAANPTH